MDKSRERGRRIEQGGRRYSKRATAGYRGVEEGEWGERGRGIVRIFRVEYIRICKSCISSLNR